MSISNLPPQRPQHTISLHSQLPSLDNPFLNALFNNTKINSNNSLHDVVDQISKYPGDYIILVPDTKFLLLSVDQDTDKSYKELSTESDFIQSHIIKVNLHKYESSIPNSISSKQLTTLNNKTITIRKSLIQNVKGFKHDFSVRILDQLFFRSFANYIPFGTNFHLFMIEEALIGNPLYSGLKKVKNLELVVPKKLSSYIDLDVTDDDAGIGLDTSPISFDDVLREVPQLGAEVGEPFKRLFQEFSVRNVTTEIELSDAFTGVMSKGSSVVNSLSDSICKDIYTQFPDLDLRQAIFNYIEMNIYDRFWARYLEIHPHREDSIVNKAYTRLKDLSITQVGLPERWFVDPDKFISLEKRVLSAIAEFRKLEFATTTFEKCSIICRTFRYLSDRTSVASKSSNGSLIDADTLISLFLLVVSHAGVFNLNSHLNYIRSYSFMDDSLESGFVGYALSSFEAVLNYYDDKSSLKQLEQYSDKNNELWQLIISVSSDSNENNTENDASNDNNIIKKVCHLIDPFDDGINIHWDCFLRSRTLNGESCLMLALLQNNFKLFKAMLDYRFVFTLDDILEDRSIDGLNLLNAALQLKHPLVGELADIILQAEEGEIESYSNAKDNKRRLLGHFLFHDYRLIPKFGRYIDWRAKDITGKTPFFTIVRCYDHPNYVDLLKVTMKSISAWYEMKGMRFDYKDHIDNKGNTLIHAIKDGQSLKQFLSEYLCLNLNYFNNNQQTPLMQYVRYNRLSNIEAILRDSRLDLLISDHRYQLTAEDYIKVEKIQDSDDSNQRANRKIMDLLDSELNRRYAVSYNGCSCCAVRVKFDANRDLCIYFRYYDDNESRMIIHSYTDFKKFFKLLKLQYAETYIGNNQVWLPGYIEISDRLNINYSKKFCLNRLLLTVNLLLSCIRFNPSLRESKITKDFLSVQKPLNEMNYLKKKQKNEENRRQEILGSDDSRLYMLKPEEVGNYKTFLKFSNAELMRLSRSLDRFYRMECFMHMKRGDLEYVKENLVYFVARSGKKESIEENLGSIPWKLLHKLADRQRDIHNLEIATYKDIFVESLKLLRESVVELTNCILRFFQGKISCWWKLYGEIKGIGDELVKILRVEKGKSAQSAAASSSSSSSSSPLSSPTVLNQVLLEVGTLIGTIDNDSAKELRSKMATTNGIYGLFESNGGYLSGIIEKRREDYTVKLIERFKKLKNEMIMLNIDLKKEYEDLCIELNNFYEFRGKVMNFAFNNLAKDRIQTLRLQKEMMMNYKSWENV
ncbi:hypothetical protein FOA43_002374 [Brettanomyces nanus]|uniref:VPS9 domain-containing protein n=1 Tax=Eeniella nana TaxID=13502 RepID=A0A875S779_EENNA|nr:uncharacterized protein FOA43_002374 [Brettanomyces nanus]QPG75034.1 hypothetical protein FOA43_002374 [Brettanomyces nanus]